MSRKHVGSHTFAPLIEVRVESHVADDGLDEVRPVEAVQTVCAEDPLLLRDHDSTVHLLLGIRSAR